MPSLEEELVQPTSPSATGNASLESELVGGNGSSLGLEGELVGIGPAKSSDVSGYPFSGLVDTVRSGITAIPSLMQGASDAGIEVMTKLPSLKYDEQEAFLEIMGDAEAKSLMDQWNESAMPEIGAFSGFGKDPGAFDEPHNKFDDPFVRSATIDDRVNSLGRNLPPELLERLRSKAKQKLTDRIQSSYESFQDPEQILPPRDDDPLLYSMIKSGGRIPLGFLALGAGAVTSTAKDLFGDRPGVPGEASNPLLLSQRITDRAQTIDKYIKDPDAFSSPMMAADSAARLARQTGMTTEEVLRNLSKSTKGQAANTFYSVFRGARQEAPLTPGFSGGIIQGVERGLVQEAGYVEQGLFGSSGIPSYQAMQGSKLLGDKESIRVMAASGELGAGPMKDPDLFVAMAQAASERMDIGDTFIEQYTAGLMHILPTMVQRGVQSSMAVAAAGVKASTFYLPSQGDIDFRIPGTRLEFQRDILKPGNKLWKQDPAGAALDSLGASVIAGKGLKATARFVNDPFKVGQWIKDVDFGLVFDDMLQERNLEDIARYPDRPPVERKPLFLPAHEPDPVLPPEQPQMLALPGNPVSPRSGAEVTPGLMRTEANLATARAVGPPGADPPYSMGLQAGAVPTAPSLPQAKTWVERLHEEAADKALALAMEIAELRKTKTLFIGKHSGKQERLKQAIDEVDRFAELREQETGAQLQALSVAEQSRAASLELEQQGRLAASQHEQLIAEMYSDLAPQQGQPGTMIRPGSEAITPPPVGEAPFLRTEAERAASRHERWKQQAAALDDLSDVSDIDLLSGISAKQSKTTSITSKRDLFNFERAHASRLGFRRQLENGNWTSDVNAYRQATSPAQRAKAMAVAGIVDKEAYRLAGIREHVIETYTKVAETNPYATRMQERHVAKQTAARSASESLLEAVEARTATSLDIPLSMYRERRSVAARASQLVLRGIDDPRAYQMIGASPSEALQHAAEGASRQKQSTIEPRPQGGVRNLIGDRKIPLDIQREAAGPFFGWSKLDVMMNVFLQDAWPILKGRRPGPTGGAVEKLVMPEFGPVARSVYGIGEFLQRPFGFVQLLPRTLDFFGQHANNLLGKGVASEARSGLFSHLFLKPTISAPAWEGGSFHALNQQQMREQAAYAARYAPHTKDLWKNSVSFKSGEARSILSDLDKSYAISKASRAVADKGSIILDAREVNLLADVARRFQRDHIVDGVPLGDLVSRRLRVGDQWVDEAAVQARIDAGEHPQRVLGEVTDQLFHPLKSIEDMTPKQQAAVVIANKYVRPLGNILWDMATQMMLGDQYLRISTAGERVYGNPLLKLPSKNVVDHMLSWMSDYYDPKGVATFLSQLGEQVSTGAITEASASQALKHVDAVLGRALPKPKELDMTASETIAWYNKPENKKWLEDNGEGHIFPFGSERFYHKKIWGDLPFSEKLEMGLLDFREASIKTLMQLGRTMSAQRLSVAMRENGLLRTTDEVKHSRFNGQFIPVEKDMVPPGVSSELSSLFVHRDAAKLLIDTQRAIEASQKLVSKALSTWKAANVLNPFGGTMQRAVIGNPFFLGAMADIPFRGGNLTWALNEVRKAAKGEMSELLFKLRRDAGFGQQTFGATEIIFDQPTLHADINIDAMMKTLHSSPGFKSADDITKLETLVGFLTESEPTLAGLKSKAKLTEADAPLRYGPQPTRAQRVAVGLETELKKVASSYGLIDDTFKLAYIKQLMDDGFSMHESVRRANDTFMDASDLAPILDRMRRSPLELGAPFITFMSKFMAKGLELFARNPWRAYAMYQAMEAYNDAMFYMLHEDPEQVEKIGGGQSFSFPLPHVTTEADPRTGMPVEAPLQVKGGMMSPLSPLEYPAGMLRDDSSAYGVARASMDMLIPDGGPMTGILNMLEDGLSGTKRGFDWGAAIDNADYTAMAGRFAGELFSPVRSVFKGMSAATGGKPMAGYVGTPSEMGMSLTGLTAFPVDALQQIIMKDEKGQRKLDRIQKRLSAADFKMQSEITRHRSPLDATRKEFYAAQQDLDAMAGEVEKESLRTLRLFQRELAHREWLMNAMGATDRLEEMNNGQ